jgi:hypothetical protein
MQSINRSHTSSLCHDTYVQPTGDAHRRSKQEKLNLFSDSLKKANYSEALMRLRGQLCRGLSKEQEDSIESDRDILQLFGNRSGYFSYKRQCTESGTLALAAYALKIFGMKILDGNHHIDSEKLQMAWHMSFGNHMPKIQSDLAQVACRNNGGVFHLRTEHYAMNIVPLGDPQFEELIQPQCVRKEFFYDKTKKELQAFLGSAHYPEAFNSCIEKVTGFWDTLSSKFRKKTPINESIDSACEKMQEGSKIYKSTVTTYLSSNEKLEQITHVQYELDSAPSTLSNPKNRLKYSGATTKPRINENIPVNGRVSSPTSSISSSEDDGVGIGKDDATRESDISPILDDPPLEKSKNFSGSDNFAEEISSTIETSIIANSNSPLGRPNNAYVAQSTVLYTQSSGAVDILVNHLTYMNGSQYGGEEGENSERAYKVLVKMVERTQAKYPDATSIHIYDSRLLSNIMFHSEKSIFEENQKGFKQAVTEFTRNSKNPSLKVSYTSVHVETHDAGLDTAKDVFVGMAAAAPIVGLSEKMEQVIVNGRPELGDIKKMREDFGTFFNAMTQKNKTEYQVVIDKWRDLSEKLKDPVNAIPFIALTAMLVDKFNDDESLHKQGTKVIDPFGCKSAKDRTTCVYLGAIMLLMPLLKFEMLNPKPNLERFFYEHGPLNFDELRPDEQEWLRANFDPDYTHEVSKINTDTYTNLNPGAIQAFYQYVDFIRDARYFLKKVES